MIGGDLAGSHPTTEGVPHPSRVCLGGDCSSHSTDSVTAVGVCCRVPHTFAPFANVWEIEFYETVDDRA